MLAYCNHRYQPKKIETDNPMVRLWVEKGHFAGDFLNQKWIFLRGYEVMFRKSGQAPLTFISPIHSGKFNSRITRLSNGLFSSSLIFCGTSGEGFSFSQRFRNVRTRFSTSKSLGSAFSFLSTERIACTRYYVFSNIALIWRFINRQRTCKGR